MCIWLDPYENLLFMENCPFLNFSCIEQYWGSKWASIIRSPDLRIWTDTKTNIYQPPSTEAGNVYLVIYLIIYKFYHKNVLLFISYFFLCQ